MSNQSCIITVIKNEHAYLKEWIEYHLNLGVNHIFIFEDIDSDTHKDITDEYVENVTLCGISSVLNDTERETAAMLKRTKKWNVQHLYLKNALRYVKDTFSDKYDWCFVIDVDEFITFADTNDKLENVLSSYTDYDAFIMFWKCYGADGHVNKPDYGDKGVVGTYTKVARNRMVDKAKSLVKTCYNLKKYVPENFHNQHRPSDMCNWCNTDFKQTIRTTYNKLYIRHYVTKSWEEYVWKKNTRGYLWGGTRSFDMFFLVNPDMFPIKSQLLKNIIK